MNPNSVINLRRLKTKIIKKYPNTKIAEILAREPDEIPATELLGKIATLQAIIDLDDENK